MMLLRCLFFRLFVVGSSYCSVTITDALVAITISKKQGTRASVRTGFFRAP